MISFLATFFAPYFNRFWFLEFYSNIVYVIEGFSGWKSFVEKEYKDFFDTAGKAFKKLLEVVRIKLRIHI